MNQKQQIITKHNDGWRNREIASQLHISKDTVNKYVREYEKAKGRCGRHRGLISGRPAPSSSLPYGVKTRSAWH